MKLTSNSIEMSLHQKVEAAAQCINSFWPLTNFIACNPLKGFENMPFEDAMQLSTELFGARGFLDLTEYRAMYESGRINPGDLQEAFSDERIVSKNFEVESSYSSCSILSEFLDDKHGSKIVTNINRQMIKWCAAFLDSTQAQWRLSNQNSLFTSWKKLAHLDYSLTIHGSRNWRKFLATLPNNSTSALEFMLDAIGIEEGDVVAYLTRHLAQLPGWASHFKWRQSGGDNEVLTDYLAIRLFYELHFAQPIYERFYNFDEKPWKFLVSPTGEFAVDSTDAELSKSDSYVAVWQDAYELNYRNWLLNELHNSQRETTQEVEKALCQLVFCIDVRSEPVRRNLEKIGLYETYGFAGFFGFAMRFQSIGSDLSLDLCPVLLSPDKLVKEVDKNGSCKRLIGVQALHASAVQLRKRLKSSLIGAFGLVENFGLASVLPLAGRTFFPRRYQKVSEALERHLCGDNHTQIDSSAFSIDDKIAMAEANLKAIGITKDFARIVVICGHGSLSSNNPYGAALECGACGGNPGGASARLAVSILNDKLVRAGLLERGLAVPEQTIFVAAEHNTTTDTFKFFDVQEIPNSHKELLDSLRSDLIRVGVLVRDERKEALPKSIVESLNDPLERSCDWAQVAPEWGLSGNAAFIAAPRSLTKSINLGGRTFLNSYDCNQDSEDKILELIMTAPLVVAQWINMQYYLSTVDNDVFGSGSKVTHNVVGDFGVMQGAASDLRIGLPAQSVMSQEGLRAHEPMRLLAIIRAPLKSIDAILSKHQDVSQLIVNRWLRLIALDPTDEEFYQAEGIEQWRHLKQEKELSVRHDDQLMLSSMNLQQQKG